MPERSFQFYLDRLSYLLIAMPALLTALFGNLKAQADPVLQDGSLAIITVEPTGGGAPIPLGYLVYDVLFPGNFGEFDIVNQTGPNSSLPTSSDFPVTTTVLFSDLSLTLNFSDGSTKALDSSD